VRAKVDRAQAGFLITIAARDKARGEEVFRRAEALRAEL
jgi:hypothetical protein